MCVCIHIHTYIYIYVCVCVCVYIYIALSHLRSKQSTGIHKPCIPGLFLLAKVHLKIDQRVQRNNFAGIHLNIHCCTSECILGKSFL